MSDTVIRDFLVSLGFSTDNEGARKMGDALKGVELKATLLHKTLLLLATGAVVAVAKTASELDKLYYSSQRIGASASNIRAYGDAISQMGGNAQNALQSLENVAQKMRNSPGYEGMLTGMGVATRDGNGQIRDRVEVMKDLSKTMKGMDYYQANAYASSLGIDENTLMAMRDDKFISNMEKYQKLRQDVGLTDELTKSGTEFMVQFRDITMTTKAITEVVVMTAGQALIPILKMINNFLRSAIAWFAELDPRFKAILATGLKFALLAVIFGGFIGTIAKLASVLPMLKGLLFLIKSLRLAFLASPIGIVLALAAAIAALWDDYQTWKNGGESLIDWSKWEGGIETAIARIKELAELIKNLKDKTVEFVTKAIDDPAGTAKETAAAITDVAKSGAAAVVNATQSTVNAIKENVSASSSSFSQKYKSKNFTSNKAKTIEAVAKSIGVDPNDLAAVISFETAGTFSPSAKNPKSSATGLIQFMEGSGGTKGKYYGMSRKKFASLSFDEQMVYVEKYFKERGFKSSKKRNVADLYTAVTGYGYKKGSRAYELNKVWDSNKDGYIAKGEMVQNKDFKKHQRNYFTPNIGTTPNINISNTKNLANVSNPHKEQVNNSNASSANITIYQSHKTDMTINGADNPKETAQVVQRHNENTMIQMARNVKPLIG
ncbi:hypothetical protein [Acinetobacter pittii]|uniref:hypothetical protein n=1 Tax=Acinetobacter pittii TaxID=48296 RepID=UPI0002F687DC|nr:hypothetical protein [Acinetobacter pittii]QRP67220.1 hypothetical protein I6J44_17400 [Acinetobacter pittii]